MAKTYFQNLDGLRFLAAATVALSHLETLKQYRSIPFLEGRFFVNSTQLAVTFFFVLSGFLIMWWSLEETGGDTTRIRPRAFYRNRIARTWPLYFLVVLSSMLVSFINGTFISDPLAVKRYMAYLFFLPNTADLFFKRDIYLGPTWSLAVEEFFYLLFPLLLLRSRKERLLNTLSILSAVFLLASTLTNRIFLHLFFPNMSFSLAANLVVTFFERYRLYAFLLGAIAAVALFYNRIPKLLCTSRNLSIGCSVLVALCYFTGITFSFLTHQVYAILFAVLILFIAARNQPMVLLHNRFAVLGGKISYSIYVLHMFVVLRLINQGSFLLQVGSRPASIFISWVVYFTGVWLAAYLSFKFFESPVRAAIRNRFTHKMVKSES
jgi:peptidoglycan/LPS O-acetylase OafA/YrhL